jgi:hypothetical protein
VRRRARLCLEIKAHLRQATLWYWSSRRWSISDAYARLRTTLAEINREREHIAGLPQLEFPSHEALRREVRATEGFDTFREKYGLKAANNRFKACGKGLTIPFFGITDAKRLRLFASWRALHPVCRR